MRTVTIDRRIGRGVRAVSTSPRRNINDSLRFGGAMDRLAREMGEWSPFDEVDEGRAASRELERSCGARGFGTRGGDAI